VAEGPALEAWWARVPAGVDILATHSPPRDRFDRDPSGTPVGSTSLIGEVQSRVKPLLHCFGHVHAGRTADMLESQRSPATSPAATLFVNGAICNDDLVAVWDPVLVDIRPPLPST